MIDGLKPYLEYKPGPPFIGRVPAHWETNRAKVYLREIDERSVGGDEEMLSVSHKTGVTPRREKNVTMFVAESNVGHKLCRADDVVINTMWAWMAALGVSRNLGIVSPSYGVYRPRRNGLFRWRYLDELLRAPGYRDEYNRLSTGITASRLRLYPDVFLRIPLLRPPPDEQEAIVRFLEHADGLIRRYVQAKQRLIKALLEERRAISQALVGGGIAPRLLLSAPKSVALPPHWNITRVKNEFVCLDSRRVPLSGVERGRMVRREYDYYGASGVIDKVEDFIFDDTLILLAEDGANLVLRNLPLAVVASGRFWVNNHAHILKPRRGNLAFLAEALENIDYLPWITGAAQPKLTRERLMAVPLVVPSPDKQDEIMRELSAKTETLDASLRVARHETAVLREFRSRLIADVVTGRVDVRDAVSSMSSFSPETSRSLDLDIDAEDPSDSDEAAGDEAVA